MKHIYSFLFLILFYGQEIIHAQKKEITLEDIWQNGTFSVKRVSGIRSMKNGEHYTTLNDQAIVMYEYKTGNVVDTVLNASWLKVKSTEPAAIIEEYQFSG